MPSREDLLKEKLDLMNPKRVERDNFLDAISQIESSGGQNLNHPIMQSGIQAGDQAMGKYGLMPNTIKELAHRNPASLPLESDLKAQLQAQPQIEQAAANQLADRLLNRMPNADMAAYAWNQGHNLTPEQVMQRNYEQSPYVLKFHKIRNKLGYK